MCSVYKFFVKYMIGKYFFTVYGLYFYPLNVFLQSNSF